MNIKPSIARLVRPVLRWRRRMLFPFEYYMVKKKCIFIHIPKAAGTSLRVALGAPETGRSHLPWWVYQKADPVRFDRYFKFAFVRHPIDRAVSAYKYLAAGGNQAEDLVLGLKINKYESFSHFVHEAMAQRDILAHPLFWPQTDFIMNHEGKIMVDFMGRMENFDEDYRVLSRRLGLSQEANWANKSEDTPILQVEEEAIRLICGLYAKDFAVLGYSQDWFGKAP